MSLFFEHYQSEKQKYRLFDFGVSLKMTKFNRIKCRWIRLLTITYVLFTVFLLIGEAESARSLKFISWAMPNSAHDIAVKQFAKQVRQKTKDAILIDVIYGEKAGITVREGLVKIQSAQLDGAVIPVSVFESVFPKISALSFPFLFADYEHVDKTVDEIGGSLLGELSEIVKIKGLAFFEDGFFDIVSTGRPIKSSKDLKGVKVRVVRPFDRPAFVALGATPVQIPFAELPMALERGLLDTAEMLIYSGPQMDVDFRPYTNLLKYVSLTEHSYRASVMVFNSNVFDSLGEDFKRVLFETAKDASLLNKRVVRKGKQEEIKIIEKLGITIVLPDRADIRKSLDPIFQNPPPEISKETIDLIKKICRFPPFCG